MNRSWHKKNPLQWISQMTPVQIQRKGKHCRQAYTTFFFGKWFSQINHEELLNNYKC